MSLSRPILAVLDHFRSAFTRPMSEQVQVRFTGTILARGRHQGNRSPREESLSGTPRRDVQPATRQMKDFRYSVSRQDAETGWSGAWPR